jgi:TrmH family RNA methyltransferase
VAVEPTPLAASNPRVSSLRRLTGRRKARIEAGLFVIEGPVALGELLAAGIELDEVYVDVDAWNGADDNSALVTAVTLASSAGTPVWGIAPEVFARVSDTATPQGVLAVAPRRVVDIDAMTALAGPILVLVDVGDPGNAGTLVRAAEAAGAAGVVFAGSSTDAFGPKTVRAAAGSLMRLPVAEIADVEGLVADLLDAGRIVLATVVEDGASPEDLDLGGSPVLLVGSEAHGLDPALVERCTGTVTIPMNLDVESINAAVAGAVVLFEAARQRRVAVKQLPSSN